MIGSIARFFGLNTVLVWALVAILGAGGIWGWGAYKHHQGYQAGTGAERIIWEEAAHKLRMEGARRLAAAQATIDQLDRELYAADKRAAMADERFEQARREQDAEDATSDAPPRQGFIPRRIARALNQVGR